MTSNVETNTSKDTCYEFCPIKEIPIKTGWDFSTWLVPKSQYEIRVRILSEKRDQNCKHGSCKDLSEDRCYKTWVCTCAEFVSGLLLCPHIVQVLRSSIKIDEGYKGRMADMHLEMLMEGGSKRDYEDDFDYKKYFSDKSNFDLSENMIDRNHYWKGYEDVLARHHYGMELLLGKRYELIRPRRVKAKTEREKLMFSEDKNGITMQYFVQFTRKMKKCLCSGFELCSTCRICRHQIFCSCEDYQFGYFCRHCHAYVMLKNEIRRRPYHFRKLSDYHRNQFRRNFYLCSWIRIRHNVGITLRTLRYPQTSTILVEDVDENEYPSVYEVEIFEDKKQWFCCSELEKCSVCGICRHIVNCHCADFNSKHLCVHVHAAMMTYKPLQNYRFSEEERMIDEVSEIDENEANRMEVEHPIARWGYGIRLEYEFLAYRHLFFEHMFSQRRNRKIISTADGKMILVSAKCVLTEGDVVLDVNNLETRKQILKEYCEFYLSSRSAKKDVVAGPLDASPKNRSRRFSTPMENVRKGILHPQQSTSKIKETSF